MTAALEKAGSGSIEPEDFNALVDAVNAQSHGGSQPLAYVALEMNVQPNAGGTAHWDKMYDRDGNELMALPDGIGFTLVNTAILTTTEAGLWSLSLMVNPNEDATATFSMTLIVGDWAGGPKYQQTPPPGEACLSWMANLGSGKEMSLFGAPAVDATDPDYKPLGYAVLEVARLG